MKDSSNDNNKIVMPDGKIKDASKIVKKYLLSIGGRELILQPINIDFEYKTNNSKTIEK